jgi:transposase
MAPLWLVQDKQQLAKPAVERCSSWHFLDGGEHQPQAGALSLIKGRGSALSVSKRNWWSGFPALFGGSDETLCWRRDRSQTTLFPRIAGDWVDENNPMRLINAFVDVLALSALGIDGVIPEATGRPSYHLAVLLKLRIDGYLNRVKSSQRLEREADCSFRLMWLTGSLMPARKTIANFCKDSDQAIRWV